MSSSRAWVNIEGEAYRVVEKPTHTVIYRRYGAGPYRDVLVWNSRDRALRVGSIFARVLAEAAQWA